MRWLRRFWGEEVQHGPVLFGLAPPRGCHFRVSNHHDSSWHVRIVCRGKELAHECELITWLGVKRSDEEVIAMAAQKALDAYGDRDAIAERERVVRELEGCYPPKNTNNKSAD